MELVEVPTRAALDEENAVDEELDEIRKATGVRKKGIFVLIPILRIVKRPVAASGTKSYILRSCLAPVLIEQAAQPDQIIKDAEGEDQAILMPQAGDDNGDEDEKYFGTLISWGTADQLGPIGILYVILSLILVNGRVLPDGVFINSARTAFPDKRQRTCDAFSKAFFSPPKETPQFTLRILHPYTTYLSTTT